MSINIPEAAIDIEGCQDDGDCPNDLICYVNQTWGMEETANGLCMCSFFYGVTGKDCTTPTGVTILFLIGYTLLMLINIGVMFASIVLLFRLQQKGGFKKVKSAIGTTTILVLLSTLFFFGLLTLRYIEIAGRGIQTRQQIVNGEKWTFQRRVANYFVSIGFLFVVCACMNLSVLWIEVGHRSMRLKKTDKNAANLNEYRRFVYGFMVIVILVVSLTTAYSRPEYTSIGVLPFILVVFGCFHYGKKILVETIESVMQVDKNGKRKSGKIGSSTEDNVTKLKKSIEDTQRSIQLWILIGVSSALGYGITRIILSGTKPKPGSWNTETWFQFALYGSIFAVNISLLKWILPKTILLKSDSSSLNHGVSPSNSKDTAENTSIHQGETFSSKVESTLLSKASNSNLLVVPKEYDSSSAAN